MFCPFRCLSNKIKHFKEIFILLSELEKESLALYASTPAADVRICSVGGCQETGSRLNCWKQFRGTPGSSARPGSHSHCAALTSPRVVFASHRCQMPDHHLHGNAPGWRMVNRAMPLILNVHNSHPRTARNANSLFPGIPPTLAASDL